MLATGDRAKTVDSDHDGCSNGNELGGSANPCGQRNPANYWDHMDMPGVGGARDCMVTSLDTVIVIKRFGTDDAGGKAGVNRYTDPITTPANLTSYHPSADRDGLAAGGHPWNVAPAEGDISSADTLATVNDFSSNNIRADNGQEGCDIPPYSIFPTKYTYDNENRLTKIENGCVSDTSCGTTVASYVYDGHGQLVQKTENGSTTSYVDNLYESNTLTGVTKYYWFAGRRVAMRSSTALSFLTADSLASSTALLDASGNVSQQEQYFPFGSTRSGSLSTDKQFTGQQKVGEFYRMGSRFYDPTVGRFLQPDSIVPDYKNPESLNRYSYVYNNPMRYIDPTGHYGQSCTVSCALSSPPGSGPVPTSGSGGSTYWPDPCPAPTPTSGCQGVPMPRPRPCGGGCIANAFYEMSPFRPLCGVITRNSRCNAPGGRNLSTVGWLLALGTVALYEVAPEASEGEIALDAAGTAAETEAATVALHYTTSETVGSIMKSGLLEGSYATTTEGLSPLQAHIELALNPAQGPRNAIIEVDLAALREAGYEIPPVTRVTGAYNMPGGGYEMRFDYRIPPKYLRVIQH